jgi:hypothetical protein
VEHYLILLYGASSYSCLLYNMYAVNKLSNVSMYLCTTIFIVFSSKSLQRFSKCSIGFLF